MYVKKLYANLDIIRQNPITLMKMSEIKNNVRTSDTLNVMSNFHHYTYIELVQN